MVATIQTKWKHNPECVYIIVQTHLDRSDRAEPSYEHFSELCRALRAAHDVLS